MVNINSLILRKFENIAGSRYEEIIKAYQEFLLSEEELVIPEIDSIVLVVDRYSGDIPEGVFRLLEAYNPMRLLLLYVIDESVCRLIRDTLGEEEAEKFRKKEEAIAASILEKVETVLKERKLRWNKELVFADKALYVEEISENYDLLVISKHYGSEATKTHMVSPIVFRIVHHVEKPVVTY